MHRSSFFMSNALGLTKRTRRPAAEDSVDLSDCELRPEILIESTMKFLRRHRRFIRSFVGANGNRPFRPFLSSPLSDSPESSFVDRPWVGLHRCIPLSLPPYPGKSRISALNLPLFSPIFLFFIGNVTVDKRACAAWISSASVPAGVGWGQKRATLLLTTNFTPRSAGAVAVAVGGGGGLTKQACVPCLRKSTTGRFTYFTGKAPLFRMSRF